MKTLEDLFRSLPPAAQSEVLECLNKALLYRGWDQLGIRMGVPHAIKEVENIAEIFEKNGFALEEYT